MTWETIFSQPYTIDDSTDRITLPLTFSPYFRLIISTELLTGLGRNETFLGTLSQQLDIPNIGTVKGRTIALSPDLQLLTPATEFPYKLLYQPIKRQFSFTLTIQSEATIPASSGSDNAPVLAAIALMQTTLNALDTTTGGSDNAPVLAAIALMQTTLNALADTPGGSDNTSVLADIAMSIEGLTVGQIGQNASFQALIDAQTALSDQLTAMSVSQQDNQTQTALSLEAIRAVLNYPTPTPTPAPTPTGYVNLTFEGVNGSQTFTDVSAYARAITRYGAAQISTAQAASGQSALLLDGSTAYLEFVWDVPLVGDFTISTDIYPAAINSDGCEIFSISSASNQVNLLLEIDPSMANRARFSLRNDSGQSYFDFHSSAAISLNIWTRVQAIVAGSTATIKLNTVTSGSTNFSGTREQGLTRARIGRLLDVAPRSFNGWLDRFSITPGAS